MPMRLVTVHLPEYMIETLHELVRAGRYPNRSDAIRNALRNFLRDEVWVLQGSVELDPRVNETIEQIFLILSERRR